MKDRNICTVRSRNAGFTLIELAVVLLILVVLAGLLLPKVDFLRASAENASGADSMTSVTANLELYKVTVGSFPDNYDSLMNASAPTTLYGSLWHELLGTGPSDPGARFTTFTLTQPYLDSLNNVGITTVFDQVGAPVFPGDSGQTKRTLAVGGTVAVINTASPAGQELIDSFYPPAGGVSGSGLPANAQLVVFGVGDNCSAVGKTMLAPPAYPVQDPTTTYNRVYAVYAVFDMTGTGLDPKVVLKGVLDGEGDYLNEEIREYYANKPQ